MGYVIVPWFGYQFCIPHFKFEFLCRTFGPWFFWQFNQTWLAQIWRPEASTSVFWKGTQKHGRGKWQGKTSMDSEVRSCWERFQDIYIIFNAMKLLSYKIDFCIAFAARYWNYQFWRETFSEMCKNSNSITWSDICKLYTKLCHLSRILQESTTCDIYISLSLFNLLQLIPKNSMHSGDFVQAIWHDLCSHHFGIALCQVRDACCSLLCFKECLEKVVFKINSSFL